MKIVVVKNNNNIKLLREITENEYESLSKDLSKISKFQKGFEIYKAITDGYKDYSEMIKLFPSGKADNKYVSSNINRFISSYLTGIKSFLDRWPTYLSKNFSSNLVEKFKEATHEEYDSSFAYRLVDQLRNYDQHCGAAPVLVVAFLKNEKPRINIFLNSNEFIENFKKLKPMVRDELKSMTSQVELTSYFVEMNKSLLRIHNKMISEISDRNFIQSCLNVLGFTLEFKQQNGDLAIIENADVIKDSATHKDMKTTLNIEPIPLSFIKYIIQSFVNTNQG